MKINAKVSIITPTYNDAETIISTINSIVKQSLENWEWIVINDGSTDNTEEIILENITKLNIQDKTKYIYKNNSDQLNAIIKGLDFIHGDYIFILHSDDILPDDIFLERCVTYMESNKNVDGIFGDLLLIDKLGRTIGIQSVRKYKKEINNNVLLLLWLGRNLYSDVGFHRRESFVTSIKYNYLTWNLPLWLDTRSNKISNLNYKNVDWPMLKYRIHDGNYINNRVGKMNVINGEMRTAVELMKHYDIKFYKLQYYIFRFLNKIKKNVVYRPIYSSRETRNKYNVIKFIIDKRYKNGFEGNVLAKSIMNFYKKKSNRVIEFDSIPSKEDVYYGSDIRRFNEKMITYELGSFYDKILDEMQLGFKEIVVNNEEEEKIMQDILKFLCIEGVNISRKP